MLISQSARIIFLFLILTIIPAAVSASPLLTVGDFKDENGISHPDFKAYLAAALQESGVVFSNSTDEHEISRYTISGLVEKGAKGTSYSALLTDNFHLEPEIFINGKQIGGSTSSPAAEKLADSAASLISNQSVSSIEITGDSRLTPDAIMALAQIFPGDPATPEKIVAARIILENCGLFDEARIFLTPGLNGRKVKISVKESRIIVAGEMPGPGISVLENILGPADSELPAFPKPLRSKKSYAPTAENDPGLLAYRAGQVLEKLSHAGEEFTPESTEELVEVAGRIRDRIHLHDASCMDLCIILMKLCSVLDSKTVRTITEKMQRAIELDSKDKSFKDKIARIEFINKAHSAAQEAQTILASRIFNNRKHSPVTPWVMYSLGTQALISEDITKAAPLLAGAISLSSLPVSPEMLLTAAKAQYSNLDRESGDAAVEMLDSLLAERELPSSLRREIKALSHWGTLCETAIAVTENDSFEMQLKKGNALILLDRPDLAEPLFHELHSSYPDDARPFSGFARLAYQRTGNLLSSRPYIERAAKLTNKDIYFYELALAFKMERIIEEALPTIHRDGRNSEEASATRFLLPKTIDYASGYERFNKPRALLIKRGVNALDNWLAYPAMTDDQAMDLMYRNTVTLREQMPEEQEIIAANYFFSMSSPNRNEVRQMLGIPLEESSRPKVRYMQLNLLINEMANNPDEDICSALEQAGRAAISDEKSRSLAVTLQADAHAILGFYRNSTAELERAASLYNLAAGLDEGPNQARLLNNQACINLALGKKEEADDLFDEAMDNSPDMQDVVKLGKILTSIEEKDQKAELERLGVETQSNKVKYAIRNLLEKQFPSPGNKITYPHTNGTDFKDGITPETGMPEVVLQEKKYMGAEYDNYNGLQLIFSYDSNPWLLPSARLPIK